MRIWEFLFAILALYASSTSGDKPCAAKLYPGESVTCVCNATYCDYVTRETPKAGQYVTYTSTASGLRLEKSFGRLKHYSYTSVRQNANPRILNPSVKYLKIIGFGGAVTDSAGINWKKMSKPLQETMIDKGIGYTMARLPIGGTDFSTRNYTYNDLPIDDKTLSNFSLAHEDYNYKIPMLRKIQSKMQVPLKIVASLWSIPEWMKKETEYNSCGHLKEEYYQLYADYYIRFIQQYAANKINMWAVTTGNEPIIGFLPAKKILCLGWYPKDMAKWIVENFGPTIRNNTNLLILAGDDQRFTIPLWVYLVAKEDDKALQYMDGIALHIYGDIITPASIMDDVVETYPDKFLIYTESCEGSYPWSNPKVLLGSWSRAETYMNNIITDINHHVTGWIDWNLCLNQHGGPTWSKNFVDSPIIVFGKEDRFEKQPMFYAMAHVAKFVDPESHRIKVVEENNKENLVDQFAVLTPNETIVVVLANNGNSSAAVGIKLGDHLVDLNLLPSSFTTVELPNEFAAGCALQTTSWDVPGTPVEVDYDCESVSVTYNPC